MHLEIQIAGPPAGGRLALACQTDQLPVGALVPRARARAATELKAAAPVRRWPELLARLPVAAELVVGGALLRILEHLISLLHFLELGFGIRLLAHVRVVFAGQPPVDLLDLIRTGRALHAQNLVVVPIFHEALCSLAEMACGHFSERAY